jgi:hypothetical protein
MFQSLRHVILTCLSSELKKAHTSLPICMTHIISLLLRTVYVTYSMKKTWRYDGRSRKAVICVQYTLTRLHSLPPRTCLHGYMTTVTTPHFYFHIRLLALHVTLTWDSSDHRDLLCQEENVLSACYNVPRTEMIVTLQWVTANYELHVTSFEVQ